MRLMNWYRLHEHVTTSRKVGFFKSVRILNGLLLLEAMSHIIFYENTSYLLPNVEVLYKLPVFKIKFKKNRPEK